jgi:hypothetical protein
MKAIATVNHADVIDVRDLIARFEELESLSDNEGGTFNAAMSDTKRAELQALKTTLSELKGMGGDEQWRGEWYPLTLIHEDHFTQYVKELATDCGYLPRDLPDWIAVDWERTAEAVQQDYLMIDIGDRTYWTR